MRELLIPYAYDPVEKRYYEPDLKAKGRELYSGNDRVYFRSPNDRRPHFYHAAGGGGGGSETAAHIYAKMYLQEHMRLLAWVNGELVYIRFETCLLEQRLAANIPDVTITVAYCWPPRHAIGSTMLIEIHATNDVTRDPIRVPRLRELEYPCIEISLPPEAVARKFKDNEDFGRQRRDFERYMDTVMQEPWHCEWVFPRGGYLIHMVRPDALQLIGARKA